MIAEPDGGDQPGLDPRAGQTLSAALSRLIPSDPTGPGAHEVGVAAYIMRRLEGRDASLAERYVRGLEGFDRHAYRRAGRSFADLPDSDQDGLLEAAEAGDLGHELAAFFTDLHRHAMEGMFGDPTHGGNADRAGWAVVGTRAPDGSGPTMTSGSRGSAECQEVSVWPTS